MKEKPYCTASRRASSKTTRPHDRQDTHDQAYIWGAPVMDLVMGDLT